MTAPNSGSENPFENNPVDPSGDTSYGPSAQFPYESSAYQQYQYQQYPDPQQQNYAAPAKAAKGFLGALFDVNFDNFISLKFAKFIYILAIAIAGIALFLGWVLPVLGFLVDGSAGAGIGWLLFGWIPITVVALFHLVGIRLFLEFVISSIKTAENTTRLVETQGR
ncbi:hypothetical protein COCCU_03240 [Corynebacterium occultum]|uniref:DUF4282 domain-containing protein n=1 Tax=Corynebacterium occultum TaxID=2675219 RepID=A0A6B8VMA0_9CORY|nr:DUF4282 domain-containing protein [Corynebacterium occultum]QGU06602.1 hypothetical protein COCCU_03240 [Corynebacterium occultum]